MTHQSRTEITSTIDKELQINWRGLNQKMTEYRGMFCVGCLKRFPHIGHFLPVEDPAVEIGNGRCRVHNACLEALLARLGLTKLGTETELVISPTTVHLGKRFWTISIVQNEQQRSLIARWQDGGGPLMGRRITQFFDNLVPTIAWSKRPTDCRIVETPYLHGMTTGYSLILEAKIICFICGEDENVLFADSQMLAKRYSALDDLENTPIDRVTIAGKRRAEELIKVATDPSLYAHRGCESRLVTDLAGG